MLQEGKCFHINQRKISKLLVCYSLFCTVEKPWGHHIIFASKKEKMDLWSKCRV